jgi:hypothetical protein
MAEQASTPAPLTDLIPAEREYLRMVRRYGSPAPLAKRLDIQTPVADDGETDCWTHAWEVARRTGGTYVEGVCIREGADGPSFHAWVEEDNPLTGRTMVEVTPGYERATRYVGIAVDSTPGGVVEKITGDWKVRSSVIQSALFGGGTVEQVLRAVAAGADR